MIELIAELYVPRTDGAAATAAAERFTRAAAELTAEGRGVQLVRSIFVPADETCLLLVEAAGPDDVREAARRAAVQLDHVAETSHEHLTTTRRTG